MGKLSQWREESSWRLEKRRGSWRNARRRGGKTNTQEPSRFPDMNMSPTFSPPPTNTTRLTRQGSPFHEAPPQRQGEGNSGKTLVAQACPVCPDFSTKAPNPFRPGEPGQLVTLPATVSTSSSSSRFKPQKQALSEPWGPAPDSPSPGRLRRTGQLRPAPPGAPVFPGTRVALHKLPAGSPKAARCGSDFPALIPSCVTRQGISFWGPRAAGRVHICQGEGVAPRDPKRSGPRNAVSKTSVCPAPCGDER